MKVTAPVLLAIVFTVLKLTEIISWSWWWVLSPLWVGFVLAVLVWVGIIFWAASRRLQ